MIFFALQYIKELKNSKEHMNLEKNKSEYILAVNKAISKNFNQSDLIFIDHDLKEIESFLTEHNVAMNKDVANEVLVLIDKKNPQVLFDVAHLVGDIKSLVSSSEDKMHIRSNAAMKNLLAKFRIPETVTTKTLNF